MLSPRDLRVKICLQDYNTFEQFLCFGEYVFGDCLARSGSETGGLGAEGPADPEYWPGGDEKDMPAAKSSDQEVSEEENEESTLDPMQNQVHLRSFGVFGMLVPRGGSGNPVNK